MGWSLVERPNVLLLLFPLLDVAVIVTLLTLHLGTGRLITFPPSLLQIHLPGLGASRTLIGNGSRVGEPPLLGEVLRLLEVLGELQTSEITMTLETSDEGPGDLLADGVDHPHVAGVLVLLLSTVATVPILVQRTHGELLIVAILHRQRFLEGATSDGLHQVEQPLLSLLLGSDALQCGIATSGLEVHDRATVPVEAVPVDIRRVLAEPVDHTLIHSEAHRGVLAVAARAVQTAENIVVRIGAVLRQLVGAVVGEGFDPVADQLGLVPRLKLLGRPVDVHIEQMVGTPDLLSDIPEGNDDLRADAIELIVPEGTGVNRLLLVAALDGRGAEIHLTSLVGAGHRQILGLTLAEGKHPGLDDLLLLLLGRESENVGVDGVEQRILRLSEASGFRRLFLGLARGFLLTHDLHVDLDQLEPKLGHLHGLLGAHVELGEHVLHSLVGLDERQQIRVLGHSLESGSVGRHGIPRKFSENITLPLSNTDTIAPA